MQENQELTKKEKYNIDMLPFSVTPITEVSLFSRHVSFPSPVRNARPAGRIRIV